MGNTGNYRPVNARMVKSELELDNKVDEIWNDNFVHDSGKCLAGECEEVPDFRLQGLAG
jgi:hypothetical protein